MGATTDGTTVLNSRRRLATGPQKRSDSSFHTEARVCTNVLFALNQGKPWESTITLELMKDKTRYEDVTHGKPCVAIYTRKPQSDD